MLCSRWHGAGVAKSWAWLSNHTYTLFVRRRCDLKIRSAVKIDLHPTPPPPNAPGHPLTSELNLNPWKPAAVQGGSLDATWSIQRPLILTSWNQRKSSDGWFRRLIRRHILVGKYNESYYKILLTVTVLRQLKQYFKIWHQNLTDSILCLSSHLMTYRKKTQKNQKTFHNLQASPSYARCCLSIAGRAKMESISPL